MKEFVEAVKRLVDLMPNGAALPQFYARDELVKVREMLAKYEAEQNCTCFELFDAWQVAEGNQCPACKGVMNHTSSSVSKR